MSVGANAGVQYIQRVNDLSQLTPIERARAEAFNNANAQAVNAQDGLTPEQRNGVILALARETNQAAMQRQFYQQPAIVVFRGTNVQVTPPATTCDHVLRGCSAAVGGAVAGAVCANPTVAKCATDTVDCAVNRAWECLLL